MYQNVCSTIDFNLSANESRCTGDFHVADNRCVFFCHPSWWSKFVWYTWQSFSLHLAKEREIYGCWCSFKMKWPRLCCSMLLSTIVLSLWKHILHMIRAILRSFWSSFFKELLWGDHPSTWCSQTWCLSITTSLKTLLEVKQDKIVIVICPFVKDFESNIAKKV